MKVRILDWLLGPRRIDRLDGIPLPVHMHAERVRQRAEHEREERERLYRDLTMLRQQLAITRRARDEGAHGHD